MAVIFQDNEFLVENRLFTGWRVTDKYLRKTYKPSRDLSVRLGLTWPLVRRFSWNDVIERSTAEGLLMQAFAAAVTEPNSEYDAVFLAGSPDDLAQQIVQAMRDAKH